jgi:hypothetical protein
MGFDLADTHSQSIVAQRPKLEPIRNPTPFPMDKLEEEGKRPNKFTCDKVPPKPFVQVIRPTSA